jgi:hypothetical protein
MTSEAAEKVGFWSFSDRARQAGVSFFRRRVGVSRRHNGLLADFFSGLFSRAGKPPFFFSEPAQPATLISTFPQPVSAVPQTSKKSTGTSVTVSRPRTESGGGTNISKWHGIQLRSGGMKLAGAVTPRLDWDNLRAAERRHRLRHSPFSPAANYSEPPKTDVNCRPPPPKSALNTKTLNQSIDSKAVSFANKLVAFNDLGDFPQSIHFIRRGCKLMNKNT